MNSMLSARAMRHPVAGHQAQPGEPPGDPFDLTVDVAPRDCGVAVDQRDLVRVPVGLQPQQPVYVHRRPGHAVRRPAGEPLLAPLFAPRVHTAECGTCPGRGGVARFGPVLVRTRPARLAGCLQHRRPPCRALPEDARERSGAAPRGRRTCARDRWLAGEAAASVGEVEQVPGTEPDPTAAAFFDVDNTVMQGASIFHLMRGLYRRKFFSTRDLVRAAWGQAYFRMVGSRTSMRWRRLASPRSPSSPGTASRSSSRSARRSSTR